MTKKVKIVGGGFAGCECAYQLLKRGVSVDMFEMKPKKFSAAHKLSTLCEPVCSNSFKSDLGFSAGALLKNEMRLLDSLVVRCAEQTSVAAGGALAVDREKFSALVTEKLSAFPDFRLVSEVETQVEQGDFDAVVIATGPLTDNALIPAFQKLFGNSFLYFFDAVAPIVTAESIDKELSFISDRYGKGNGDYVNCPMDKEQFDAFREALVTAETAEVEGFENNMVFEGCMPVEVMAKRGVDTIRFGPLKPVGLTFNGKRPYAVVQLRSENKENSLYNLVGFQTHLKWGEQKRVFSLIPALHDAEFVRFGVMHRNTYINSPMFLNKNQSLKSQPNIFFAGQLTGVEGYMESCASGLCAGISAFRQIEGLSVVDYTDCTLLGALQNHVSERSDNYQPMNANFGILSPVGNFRDKELKKKTYCERSLEKLKEIVAQYTI